MSDKLTDLKTRMARILNVSVSLGDTNALFRITDEAYQLGREERDAELAAELTGGSSILRDPIVVDNPAGDAWLEGD